MTDTPQRVVVDLGFKPRPWQEKVFLAMRRYSVLIVHGRAGKTVLAVLWLIDQALKVQTRDGVCAFVSVELQQAKRNAWGYLKRYACLIPGTVVHEAELYVELCNGSRIWLFGADNPDRLRGIYLDAVALDELAQMKPETWYEVISLRLLDRKGKALFIGTVKGITLLSTLYRQALKGALGEDWMAMKLTCWDTDVFPREDLEDLKKTMGEKWFRQEMECDDQVETSGQLIPFDVVQRALGKRKREEEYEHAARIIGVDVARSDTGDRSVIFRRQGLMSWLEFAERGVDNMTLAAKVAEVWDRWGADACFIDAGRGEGVIDRLVQLHYRPIQVNFGGKPLTPHYVNKRAEMWDSIREWLEEGGCLPDMEDLQVDLCSPLYERLPSNDKIKLESKDDLKARGMPSPDLGDALALTFAAPVRPLARTDYEKLEAKLTAEKSGGDYDIFARCMKPW